MYFAWSRPDEENAQLGTLENRFTALFESRRIQWPRQEHLADPAKFDQGIAGFLDHILLANFAMFADLPHMIPYLWAGVFIFAGWLYSRRAKVMEAEERMPRMLAIRSRCFVWVP